jgi:hypothetical protein
MVCITSDGSGGIQAEVKMMGELESPTGGLLWVGFEVSKRVRHHLKLHFTIGRILTVQEKCYPIYEPSPK